MPGLEPRLTIRAIKPLVSGLRMLGHDPMPIVAAAGIDPATLNDPDVRVPMNLAIALMTHAVERTGDTNLGLHLAEHMELGSVDVHFYAMASSPTLGAAYERLCRYQRLIHDTSRIELEVNRTQATLRHRMPDGLGAPRQSAEFLLAAWVRAGRMVTGVDWAPLEVRFAHPVPPDPREHARFFRSDVRFSAGENALVLEAGLLDTPCTRADEALIAVLDRHASDRLEKAPQTSSVADRIRSALAEDLKGGEPAAVQLAGRLKMSVRTLNRLLASEATSYRELLDSLRRELALRHLGADQLSIAEIGFLLGFSELSSFHRAFRRWTGETPSDFRRRVRSSAR